MEIRFSKTLYTSRGGRYMSQYTSFFLKGDDKFYSLGDWGRSSYVAQIANPHLSNRYDVAKHCSTLLLVEMEHEAREKAKRAREKIKEYQKKIELVANFNNSTNEKLNIIAEYEELIADCDEEQASYEHASSYFSFLVELEYPVYAGIECGDQPEKVEE